jgi:hypothetical protein
MLGKHRDFTFEFWEFDLAPPAPGMLGKQRDFTFEICEFDLAPAPRNARKTMGFHLRIL